jgi:hypothetical protein
MWNVVSGLIIASGLWAMAQAISNVAKGIERSNKLKVAELQASGINTEIEQPPHGADLEPRTASTGTASAGRSAASLVSGGSASSGR